MADHYRNDNRTHFQREHSSSDYRRQRSRSPDKSRDHRRDRSRSKENQGRYGDERRNDYRKRYDRPRSPLRGGESGVRGSSGPGVAAYSNLPLDPKLPVVEDDPRVNNGVKQVRMKGKGQNTESFDPKSTLVRPDLRVLIGKNAEVYGKPLKHDDIVIVPNFFCDEDDWSLYYKLIEEMREEQSKGVKGAEWTSWAEGAHLISQNPANSESFKYVQDKISKYFEVSNDSVGTRLNWYRDSTDWKPFHHDSAAFNPKRAANQNITVGASFGCTRELALLSAKDGSKVYFPQTNGMLFSFGRDVNINWKHGVNALSEEEQAGVEGKGRVSIILWGLAGNCIEEANSPPMLPYTGHSGGKGGKGNGNRDRERNTGGRGAPCRDFQRGSCSYGDSCRFSH
jgi:hypothetical protein